MTLIVDKGSDGPRVHVLAIGVGAYRHLPGGSEPVAHDTLNLQQLSGPQVSATAFTDWVGDQLRHPTAPLGTVELLVSPSEDRPGPEGAAAEVELPTRQNVQAAFDRWFARCDTDPGNVALFYFCGHGVERESEYALLEDFGTTPNRLLENGVDVGMTYRGMARCAARSQFFFVDACREVPFQLLTKLGEKAPPLITPDLGDDRTSTALLFATSGGHKAYGKPGQVTRFTEALLRALGGLGSVKTPEGWIVDIPGIHRAITRLLARETGAPVQVPATRESGLGQVHLCTAPPVVPISIVCAPGEAARAAQLALATLTGPTDVVATLSESTWSLDVPADIYLLSIDFPTGDYAPLTKHPVVAQPPGYDLEVAVSRP